MYQIARIENQFYEVVMLNQNSISRSRAVVTQTNTNKVTRGAAGIVAELRRSIVDGEYAYNERLPSERRLASLFGAARGTVREALRQLEQTHFVTRRGGSGTYVRYRERMSKDDIAEVTSPLELIEVRLAVETRLARLAVLNASGRNIQHLQDTLQRLDAAGDDPNAFSKADEDFHLALAECAQNALMLWLYHRINDIRGHNQWNARKDKILTAQRICEYNQQHLELFLAVQSRDIQRAEKAITEHLNKARQDLLGYVSNSETDF